MHWRPDRFALCLWLAAMPAVAQDLLVEVDGLEPDVLEVRAFELATDQQIAVEATGLEIEHTYGKVKKKKTLADAWILDAETREVVWEMETSRSVSGRRGHREYEDRVRLGPGTYEAYYATFPAKRHDACCGSWWEGAARSLARTLGWDDTLDLEKAVSGLKLTVRGRGRPLGARALEDVRERMRAEALVSFSELSDDDRREQGFALEQPLELRLYALGELTEEGGYDYGWILDAETRKKVWTFAFEDSERAGGAGKNRVVRQTLSLPAGKYAAVFITDGSHSPGRWNSMPPHDPDFWGLTLTVAEPAKSRYASTFDYSHLPPRDRVVAELIRVRDRQQKSLGFTLAEPMEVRIYALGEGFGRDGLADYGWIVDARTRRPVWTMAYERTQHAGGGAKNRVADETLRLEAGSYVISYVSDGSHAYRDWNDDPPSHPERWGVTVYAAGEDFDPSVVSEYRPERDPSIVARIAAVPSGRHLRERFSLDRRAQVAIYAVGEGTHGEMHDYGWLEDDRGRVVWEMTYPTTDGAGGASKNRLFQGTLELEAGDYVLHYRTDGSHAFTDWNAPPPYDPEGWGIQVAYLER